MILFCQLTFLGPASSPGDAKCSGLSVEPCCHLWACPAPLTWEQWDRVMAGKSLPCWPCVTHLMDQPHMTHSGGPILDCLMCSSAPKFHRRALCSPLLAFQVKAPSSRRLMDWLTLLAEVTSSHGCRIPSIQLSFRL